MARSPTGSLRAVLYSFSVLFLAVYHPPAGAKDAKLKPEELIAKHLDSIGTAEARLAAKNRVSTGVGQVVFRLPTTGVKQGNADMISEGRKLRIWMTFNANDYPSERFCFDGSKVTVSQIQPGMRSYLAAFVYQYDFLLKEGLIGGSMSTAWSLLDVAERQPKLDYNGLKKVDGKQMHEIRYRARKGAGELIVSLHFDPETFRHVNTEYRLVQPPNMANNPTASSAQQDTIYHIEETFGDFKTVDSLTVPHSWKITFSREGMGSTVLCEDGLGISQVLHNQTLAPRTFIAP
jgi:hypothetical protein